MKIYGDQMRVPCVVMRGGTSKGLYFHERDVPPPGTDRDAFLKRVMGTPDPIQIDGLGGSRLITSKVAIIRASDRTDADVDYTSAQVDIERDRVDNVGNCGNISAGVGPFAIDEGLVKACDPITTVRIHNTNTGKLLVARVPTRDGKASSQGDCRIAGVPGTGAEILIDYSGAVGAKSGHLLPSGNATDRFDLLSGQSIEVSLVDVANPCVFVEATALGLTGSELPEQLTADSALLEVVSELQARAGERMGLWADWRDVRLPQLPLFVLVAPPADYVDSTGAAHPSAEMDLRARLLFFGKWHESMAGTGSMCLAAASRVPGTVVYRVTAAATGDRVLRIGHPLGVMQVKVHAEVATEEPARVRITELGLTRTARRLMAGEVYVPACRHELGNPV